MIKAFLFDLYDTLAHIDTDSYLAVKAEMSAKLGVPADQFLQVWKSYTPRSSKGDVLTVEERVAQVMRDLDARTETSVIRDVALLEYQLQTEHAYLFDDVVEVLSYLRNRRVKLGLVTNAPSYMRCVPGILGIEQYFDTVVFSFELRVLKPHPHIYLAACNDLGVEPSECVFIGDGNDRELDGAHGLGMISVIVGQGRSEILSGEQSQGYDFRIGKINELKEMLEKIGGA